MDEQIISELKNRTKRVGLLFIASFFFFFLFGYKTGNFDIPGMSIHTLPYVSLSYQDSFAVSFFEYVRNHLVPTFVKPLVTHPIGGFGMIMKTSLMLSCFVTIPYGTYESVRFLSPGLYEKEKTMLKKTIIPVTALFFAGAAFAFFVFLPVAYQFLYGWSQWLGVTSMITLGNLASFTISIMIISGIIFELPILMLALTKLDVVTAEQWGKYKLETCYVLTALAMLAPGGLGISIFLIIPVIGLYFVGLYLSKKYSSEGGDN